MTKIIDWSCRIIASLILIQTLFFKFTGAEESIFIFSELNMEPWGRYATGIAELIAAILILIPRTIWLGALSSLGIISGAILGHIFKIGIIVNDDGGLLFILAIIVFITSAITLIINHDRLLLDLRKVL